MLQIYVVFLLKTTIYVHYFNISGHIIYSCPLLSLNRALLVRFLEQNNGTISKRVRGKEFKNLTDIEIKEIEKQCKTCFESKHSGLNANK